MQAYWKSSKKQSSTTFEAFYSKYQMQDPLTRSSHKDHPIVPSKKLPVKADIY
jgi:hypothetical protein